MSAWKEKRAPEFELDQGIATYRGYGTNWFPRMPAGIEKLWEYAGIKLFEKYIKAHGLPDVVHVHSMLYAGVIALRIKSRYGIPYVVTEHSSAFARGFIKKSSLTIAAKIQAGAENVFSVSEKFSATLEEIFPKRSSPWGVVPNIVSQKFTDAAVGKSKALKEFGFLNIALMNKNKNQKNIIEAFAKYFPKNADITLTIGGGGEEMKSLKELAEDLGVAKRVRFPGMLSRARVLELMSATDVFVLSSDYETFGVVLIEALALGKPVIATRCGGPESIVGERDGILVDVGDVHDLGKAMIRLHSEYFKFDPNEIRARCVERYSESVVARSLLEIYASIDSKKLSPNALIG